VENVLTFLEWLEQGKSRGFISDTFCITHDGPPMTLEEMIDSDEHGEDPCMFAVRFFTD